MLVYASFFGDFVFNFLDVVRKYVSEGRKTNRRKNDKSHSTGNTDVNV